MFGIPPYARVVASRCCMQTDLCQTKSFLAEEMSRELGICDEVRFVGKQQDMEEIFAVADLFLLPSEYKSFGLAGLEAMAAGAPIISTNAGGLPEIVQQGICGYMADVGDVDAMSKYALDILTDDKTLASFKEAARAQSRKFDIHNIIPEYETLYQQVAGMKMEVEG